MTLAELHLTVRALLRGTPYRSFVINVESVETHPGRVAVEWRLCVTDTIPPIFFRGPNPFELAARLRQKIAGERERDTATPELAAVGAPPEEDRG